MSKYINADALKRNLKENYTFYGFVDFLKDFYVAIDEEPSIDIVRCKECKYRYMDADLQVWTCPYGLMIKPDGFCSYGEREGE